MAYRQRAIHWLTILRTSRCADSRHVAASRTGRANRRHSRGSVHLGALVRPWSGRSSSADLVQDDREHCRRPVAGCRQFSGLAPTAIKDFAGPEPDGGADAARPWRCDPGRICGRYFTWDRYLVPHRREFALSRTPVAANGTRVRVARRKRFDDPAIQQPALPARRPVDHPPCRVLSRHDRRPSFTLPA